MFEDSRTKVFVCNVTNAAGAADIELLPSQSGSFYVDPETQKEDAIATVPTRFVYRNTAGVLSFTPYFTTANIRNAGCKAYAARTEQITYLGYNGTSGSLDAANSTYYGLKIILNHTFGMLNNSPIILTVPYKTDATATQYELANGLATIARAVLARHNACIKVEVINDGAVSNALGTATVSVVNGGKQIVFSEDMTALVVADTLVRLGGIGAGVQPVYKVVSHDSGAAAARVYTLDRPYEGATAAALAANLAESVIEGNYGLKFTGVSVTDANFNPVTDEPFVVSFELEAGDFTTATVTYSTNPSLGVGTYQQAAAFEAYAQFQNKTREISAYPPTTRNIDATAGTDYDVLSWEIWDPLVISATTGIVEYSKTKYVIFNHHANQAAEAFHTVLGVSF
jgi:hypothetical protein